MVLTNRRYTSQPLGQTTGRGRRRASSPIWTRGTVGSSFRQGRRGPARGIIPALPAPAVSWLPERVSAAEHGMIREWGRAESRPGETTRDDGNTGVVLVIST